MSEKNYVASSIKKVTTQYGELFNASIKIDDDSSKEREERPYAYIYHRNISSHSNSLFEAIDIFASIERDATIVGHPAIVFAISRWHRPRLPLFGSRVRCLSAR